MLWSYMFSFSSEIQCIESYHFFQSVKFAKASWLNDKVPIECHTASVRTPQNIKQIRETKVGFLFLVFTETNKTEQSLVALHMVMGAKYRWSLIHSMEEEASVSKQFTHLRDDNLPTRRMPTYIIANSEVSRTISSIVMVGLLLLVSGKLWYELNTCLGIHPQTFARNADTVVLCSNAKGSFSSSMLFQFIRLSWSHFSFFIVCSLPWLFCHLPVIGGKRL